MAMQQEERPHALSSIFLVQLADEAAAKVDQRIVFGRGLVGVGQSSWGPVLKVGVAIPLGRNWIVDAAYTRYDIHTTAIDPSAWKPAEPYAERYPPAQYAVKPVETSTRPYSPLSTIYPRFWLPWFGYSKDSGTLYGFLTFGQDAVERHSYTVIGLYGPQHGNGNKDDAE